MIIPRAEDAIHKAWLYRLLTAIFDQPKISHVLAFKGGTCAAMLGWLDRFSVDLDFDYLGTADDMPATRQILEDIFLRIGLEIKDQSTQVPQYFLRYRSAPNKRCTLKIDALFPPVSSNVYAPQRFIEIDRIIQCQSLETMFANKLCAIMDRYSQRQVIAGRDIYDIHHFFLQGYRYRAEVITERTNKTLKDFFGELVHFVQTHITQKIIDQDLNTLLPRESFLTIRSNIQSEVVMFLQDEERRISARK